MFLVFPHLPSNQKKKKIKKPQRPKPKKPLKQNHNPLMLSFADLLSASSQCAEVPHPWIHHPDAWHPSNGSINQALWELLLSKPRKKLSRFKKWNGTCTHPTWLALKLHGFKDDWLRPIPLLCKKGHEKGFSEPALDWGSQPQPVTLGIHQESTQSPKQAKLYVQAEYINEFSYFTPSPRQLKSSSEAANYSTAPCW